MKISICNSFNSYSPSKREPVHQTFGNNSLPSSRSGGLTDSMFRMSRYMEWLPFIQHCITSLVKNLTRHRKYLLPGNWCKSSLPVALLEERDGTGVVPEEEDNDTEGEEAPDLWVVEDADSIPDVQACTGRRMLHWKHSRCTVKDKSVSSVSLSRTRGMNCSSVSSDEGLVRCNSTTISTNSSHFWTVSFPSVSTHEYSTIRTSSAPYRETMSTRLSSLSARCCSVINIVSFRRHAQMYAL
mmetsp:Transcript_18701/g.32526  ORF Transcript_18701/g.32526 Transcript_18701/m.32526 type:complete len:241 (-) Transcript_18701:577-1299(-)